MGGWAYGSSQELAIPIRLAHDGDRTGRRIRLESTMRFPTLVATTLAIVSLLPRDATAQDLTITVNPNHVTYVQPPHFHGINLDVGVGDKLATSPVVPDALSGARMHNIRFPGGITTDYYYWDCGYFNPDRTGSERCNDQPLDVFFGSPVDLYGDFYATVSHQDYSSLPNPYGHLDPMHTALKMYANWANSWNTTHSRTRMSWQEVQDLSWESAGPNAYMLLQTNVFGTANPNVQPQLAGGVTHVGGLPAYAGQFAHAARNLNVDFEIGNEPDLFVGLNNHYYSGWDDWWWMFEYIERFQEQKAAIRAATPRGSTPPRVFGPVVNAAHMNESAAYAADICVPWRYLSTCFVDNAWGLGVPSAYMQIIDTPNTGPDGRMMGYRGNGDLHGWRILDNFLRLTAQGERADGISIHLYPGNVKFGATDPAAAIARVRALVRHHYGAFVDLPIVVSEWHNGRVTSTCDTVNGRSTIVPSHNASVGSALGQLQYLGMLAEAGVESHNFHSLHDTGPMKPVVFGDSNGPMDACRQPTTGFVMTDIGARMGMLTGFSDQMATLTMDAPRPADEASPTYYAMALWGQHMGDRVLSAPLRHGWPTEQQVQAFATKKADGTVQVLALNLTGGPRTMCINFSNAGSNDYSSATYIRLEAPAGTDHNSVWTRTGVRVNGQNWGPNQMDLPSSRRAISDGAGMYAHLAPYSATVYEFSPRELLPTGGGLGWPDDGPRDEILRFE